MAEKRMTLTDVALKINAHLRRMERDPQINLDRYYHAGAHRAGATVAVRYISYQCKWNLTRAQAEEYLARLDAGEHVQHFCLQPALGWRTA